MEETRYTYFEDENMTVWVQEVDGYAFIHMDVTQWNKQVFREIRSRADGLFEDIKGRGYPWAFATSDEEKSTRFWNMMKPCDEINKFGPEDEYFIGAWRLED